MNENFVGGLVPTAPVTVYSRPNHINIFLRHSQTHETQPLPADSEKLFYTDTFVAVTIKFFWFMKDFSVSVNATPYFLPIYSYFCFQ